MNIAGRERAHADLTSTLPMSPRLSVLVLAEGICDKQERGMSNMNPCEYRIFHLRTPFSSFLLGICVSSQHVEINNGSNFLAPVSRIYPQQISASERRFETGRAACSSYHTVQCGRHRAELVWHRQHQVGVRKKSLICTP